MANQGAESSGDEAFVTTPSPNMRRYTIVLSHQEAEYADSEEEIGSNSSLIENDSTSSPALLSKSNINNEEVSENEIEEMLSKLNVSEEDSDLENHTEDKDTHRGKSQVKRPKRKVTNSQPTKVVKENNKSSKQVNSAQEFDEVESLPAAPSHPQHKVTNSKKPKKGKKENSLEDNDVPSMATCNNEPTNIEKGQIDEEIKQKKTKRIQRGKQNKQNETNNEAKSFMQLIGDDNQSKTEDVESHPQTNVEEITNPQVQTTFAVKKVQVLKKSGKKQNQTGNLKENSDVQEMAVKSINKATETAVEKKTKNIKVLETKEINNIIESKTTRSTRAKANAALKEENAATDTNIVDNINGKEPKKGRAKRNKEPQEQTKNIEPEPDSYTACKKPKKKLNSVKQKESEVPDESLSTQKTKTSSKINSVKAKIISHDKENNDTTETIVKKRVTRKK